MANNRRIVAVSYAFFALLAGFFLDAVLQRLLRVFPATQPATADLEWLKPVGLTWQWTTVIGLLLAAGLAYYLWLRDDVREPAIEVVVELRKVVWPGLEETRAATIAVIVATLISAGLLGLFDTLWQFVTNKIQNPGA